jgi:hypothetical protein
MNAMDPQTANLLIGLVIIALIAIGGWFLYQRTESRKLEERFGPEYRRALDRHGDRAKAEQELRSRQKRVEKLNIVPLMPADAAHFSDAWKALQARFVDDPKGVLGEADQLVRELMLKRGYPMAEFEDRAADISVDHPAVVDHYRAAQAITLRAQRGQGDTEDMRKAVVHFRALFQELLEVVPVPTIQGQHAEARS